MFNNRNAVLLAVFAVCISFSCENTTPSTFPETCAEVQEATVDETGEKPYNGTYTLYIGGDETMPWDAYCYNMRRADPIEFLSVNEVDNYSQFSGDEITETTFQRYRIDPISLEIDLLDDTFATTDGDTDVIPDDREHLPVGFAQFSDGVVFGAASAEAKIDLTDTAFAFAESVNEDDFFCTVDSGGGDASDSDINIAADLFSVVLSATNTISSVVTKTVTDCEHLSVTDMMGEEDFTEGVLPLQYVGSGI